MKVIYTPFFRDAPTSMFELPKPLNWTSTKIEEPKSEVPVEESTKKEPEKPITPEIKINTNTKGYQVFEEAYKLSGVDPSMFNFFKLLASKESGFNPTAKNPYAPVWGYFQMLEGDVNGKYYNNATRFSGNTLEHFLNSPISQIKAAKNLADYYMSCFDEETLELARQQGYSRSALIAGAWAGGPGNVAKFLKSGFNASDRHWHPNGNGTDVKTRMDEFNNMFKDGGVLKFKSGGKSDNEPTDDSESIPVTSDIAEIRENAVNNSKNWTSNWFNNRDQFKQNWNEYSSIPFAGNLALRMTLNNIKNVPISFTQNLPDDVNAWYEVNKREISSRTPNESTLIHELTHASIPEAQISKIDDLKNQFGQAMYVNLRTLEDEYLDDSAEMYSRFMELRHHLKIDPKHEFTEKEVEELQNKFVSGKVLVIPSTDGSPSTKVGFIGDDVYRGDFKENMDWHNPSLQVFYRSDKEAFNILNRYNPKFITRVLNEVAFSNKPKISKAKIGGTLKWKI